jgi:hypothetical protein
MTRRISLAVLAGIYVLMVVLIGVSNANPAAAVGITIGVTVAILTSLALYFLPWLIARYRQVPNVTQIFWVNFLAGFTMVGWVIAFAMAFAVQRNGVTP